MKHVDNRGLSNSSGDQGDARYRFGEGHRTREWTTEDFQIHRAIREMHATDSEKDTERVSGPQHVLKRCAWLAWYGTRE
jgi:hypothetical protein